MRFAAYFDSPLFRNPYFGLLMDDEEMFFSLLPFFSQREGFFPQDTLPAGF